MSLGAADAVAGQFKDSGIAGRRQGEDSRRAAREGVLQRRGNIQVRCQFGQNGEHIIRQVKV